MIQLVSKARRLADESNMNVAFACIGAEHKEQFKRISTYGVNTIYFTEYEKMTDEIAVSDILGNIIKEMKPRVVLFPATDFGKAVAAILSTRFEAGLTADVISLDYEEGTFNFSRAAINDSLVAKIQCINCDIMMCTIKENAFAMGKCDNVEEANVVMMEVPEIQVDRVAKKEILSTKIVEKEEIDINQFSIVFCLGRGVVLSNTKDRIVKLAEQLGAGIIGTRAAVEDKICSKGLQVGQSGKNISPKLYVGFGVSGAFQHMVGIKNADIIVAINQDKNAPIFQYANYAICEKIENVLEEMETQVSSLNYFQC